jgi:subtilisin family serine protease
VDQGIRFDHPGIAGNLTNDGYDFVTDRLVPACAGGFVSNAGDGNGYDPDPTIPAAYEMDPVNNCAVGLESSGAHGLHVAGTIGAVGNDGIGVTGVNWVVRIRPVRVLGTTGSGTDADVTNGILYAAGLPVDTGAGGPPISRASAARIINLSLGGPVAPWRNRWLLCPLRTLELLSSRRPATTVADGPSLLPPRFPKRCLFRPSGPISIWRAIRISRALTVSPHPGRHPTWCDIRHHVHRLEFPDEHTDL